MRRTSIINDNWVIYKPLQKKKKKKDKPKKPNNKIFIIFTAEIVSVESEAWHSTTPPARPMSHDRTYYFLPYWDDKPCVYVRSISFTKIKVILKFWTIRMLVIYKSRTISIPIIPKKNLEGGGYDEWCNFRAKFFQFQESFYDEVKISISPICLKVLCSFSFFFF